MKPDRGTLFLFSTGLALIVLTIVLAAAVVTSLPQTPSMPGSDEGLLQGTTGDMPSLAVQVTKTVYYPGISTTYKFSSQYPRSIGNILGPFGGYGGDLYGDELILNDDGTVTISITKYGKYIKAGQWNKVTGKGHTIYCNIGCTDLSPDFAYRIYSFAGSIEIVNRDGVDYFQALSNDFIGGDYNDWDAGYATMDAPAGSLAGYIDSCIPADVARPYVEKGYTGAQGAPYIAHNMSVETAEYFIGQGISADLCGPYYDVGVSREDTVAYLDSGFTAEQVMPYVHAGVPESDTMTYLDAGYTFDRAGPFINAKVSESDTMTYLDAGVAYSKAKPYIDANAPASTAIPYATSSYSSDQCMPFVNANIGISKARPFLLFQIPSDQAVIYINNDVSASAAKPYVDAGVPAEKAVDEIRQGIPPAV